MKVYQRYRKVCTWFVGWLDAAYVGLSTIGHWFVWTSRLNVGSAKADKAVENTSWEHAAVQPSGSIVNDWVLPGPLFAWTFVAVPSHTLLPPHTNLMKRLRSSSQNRRGKGTGIICMRKSMRGNIVILLIFVRPTHVKDALSQDCKAWWIFPSKGAKLCVYRESERLVSWTPKYPIEGDAHVKGKDPLKEEARAKGTVIVRISDTV